MTDPNPVPDRTLGVALRDACTPEVRLGSKAGISAPSADVGLAPLPASRRPPQGWSMGLLSGAFDSGFAGLVPADPLSNKGPAQ